MNTNPEIKEAVKQKYAEIAQGEAAAEKAVSSCCGSGGCGSTEVVNMALSYDDAARAAIPDGADLGLGCGTPAAFADLKDGMTVLDLGSGAARWSWTSAQARGSTASSHRSMSARTAK